MSEPKWPTAQNVVEISDKLLLPENSDLCWFVLHVMAGDRFSFSENTRNLLPMLDREMRERGYTGPHILDRWYELLGKKVAFETTGPAYGAICRAVQTTLRAKFNGELVSPVAPGFVERAGEYY